MIITPSRRALMALGGAPAVKPGGALDARVAPPPVSNDPIRFCVECSHMLPDDGVLICRQCREAA